MASYVADLLLYHLHVALLSYRTPPNQFESVLIPAAIPGLFSDEYPTLPLTKHGGRPDRSIALLPRYSQLAIPCHTQKCDRRRGSSSEGASTIVPVGLCLWRKRIRSTTWKVGLALCETRASLMFRTEYGSGCLDRMTVRKAGWCSCMA